MPFALHTSADTVKIVYLTCDSAFAAADAAKCAQSGGTYGASVVGASPITIHPLSPRDMSSAQRTAGTLSKRYQDAEAEHEAAVEAEVDRQLRLTSNPLEAEPRVREIVARMYPFDSGERAAWFERFAYAVVDAGFVACPDLTRADIARLPVRAVLELAERILAISIVGPEGKA